MSGDPASDPPDQRPDPAEEPTGSDGTPRGKALAALSLATIGIVYGDIGTSPIYALRESFVEHEGIVVDPANVFGVLSLVFWSLIIVISFKYLTLIMQADNEGEGGIIALTALIRPEGRAEPGTTQWGLVLLGLFGAALLWGDSMITPAISVLSAVEGLGVATPVFEPYVIPITVGILVGLFAFQRWGTAGVGAVFGPVTTIWFLTLATLGATHVVQNPSVLTAVSPTHAVAFFQRNSWEGFFVLGSVFLVVTGGEALYADMGHFGTFPIRLTWFSLVLPALVLNYFGQGALVLSNPEAIRQPFYLMAPSWALYPLVGLTTAATVIASQAVISGSFSLTRQAVQLGYLPRMKIEHTSERKMGQIYLPTVNWILMISCIGLVIGFGTSSNLAAAYGVAVTTDMLFTTLLFAVVAYVRFGWNRFLLGGLVLSLLVVDTAFWGATLEKIPEGGWFPLVVALLFFVVMTTWKRGREILADRMAEEAAGWNELETLLDAWEVTRVRGTAVYMHSDLGRIPPALIDNARHNHVVHERIVDLTVVTEETPYVGREDRYELDEIADGFYRLVARFGFAEDPHIPRLLSGIEIDGEGFDLEETTFFLGREVLLATDRQGMMQWRERLFARLSRNSRRATSYFRLPPESVVEISRQIEL